LQAPHSNGGRAKKDRDFDMERKNKKTPVENHKNAAWANREKEKKVSRVNKPSLEQTANAKEYVDENQK
jgi:hypothetical protein